MDDDANICASLGSEAHRRVHLREQSGLQSAIWEVGCGGVLDWLQVLKTVQICEAVNELEYRKSPPFEGGVLASLRAGGVVKKPPLSAPFLDASRYRARASRAQPPLLQKEGIFAFTPMTAQFANGD